MQRVNDDYTTFIDIVVGYEKGEFISYDRFEKGYVLPEDCRNKQGGNVFVENLAESIRADIAHVNETKQYPFKLSVSMGGSGWKAREIESLDGLIEQADQKMYAEKRAKKLAVAEALKKDNK